MRPDSAPPFARGNPAPLMAGDFRFFRHSHLRTHRPFGIAVDGQGRLWEGCTDDFLVHDTRTGIARRVAVPELLGKSLTGVAEFQGRICVAHQACDHLTAYDPSSARAARVPLPGPRPNVWWIANAGDKLVLLDRSDAGGVLFLDSPSGPVRKRAATGGRFPSGGRLLPDGRALVISDPAKVLLLLDLAREEVVDEIPLPSPDVVLSEAMVHDGVLYGADSAAGRFVVFRFSDRRWLDPLPVPGFGEVFGYIGSGFQRGSCGYFCLSTFAHPSRLDPATGALVLPPNAETGIDGRPHHFLDRFLVFDAAAARFDFLRVPAQPDGYAQVCYSLGQGGSAFVTGCVVPLAADGGPGQGPGDWLVWQHSAAGDAAEPVGR